MPKYIVEVMPKEEILDPQGKAITNAVNRNKDDKSPEIKLIRQGKRFEVVLEGENSEENLSYVTDLAHNLLCNGVIEDVISISLGDK